VILELDGIKQFIYQNIKLPTLLQGFPASVRPFVVVVGEQEGGDARFIRFMSVAMGRTARWMVL